MEDMQRRHERILGKTLKCYRTQMEELKDFVQEICSKLEETRLALSNLRTIKAIVKTHWENQ